MARTTRELSDAQWAKLAPLLPPQPPRMGRPPKDHRLIVEAIVCLDAPGRPGGTCGRVWALGDGGQPVLPVAPPARVGQGVAALQADADARGELEWLLHHVDGSVVRAHQHAAGARRRPAKADLDTGGSRRS